MTTTKRFVSYGVIAVLMVWAALPALAGAAVVSDGRLKLSDPRPNQEGVSYTFSASGFTTGSTIGCIEVDLNTAANGTGTAPSGIDTSESTLESTDLVGGGWTVDNTGGNGTLRITNGTPENPDSSGEVEWGNIENGDTPDETYFAIFTTYETDSCTTAVDNTVVAFVYTDGSLVELSIEPTLTFTVAGVSDSQSVNGATTSISTDATSIDFDNSVTASANGISAHDLQVDTNAPGGYTVYIRHTGDLSNGSHNIDNHAGTNATPTSFPGSGTEAWGYTSTDLFGSNLWAGFTTTNEPVMENASATGGTDTERVGHQVGIDATTPAGTYQTTIIYTVASTY